MGLTGDPMATPSTCSYNWPWKDKYVLWRRNHNKWIMSLTGNTALSYRMLSCSNKQLIMPKAGSTRTEVNKAVTLYELRNSSGCNVTLLACLTESCVLWMWWTDLATSGLSILVHTLAASYVTDPLLDTIGLRRVSGLWIFGSPSKLGAQHPMGYMYLYVLSSKPVSFLTFLSMVISLAFILLGGILEGWICRPAALQDCWLCLHILACQWPPWWLLYLLLGLS